MDWNEEVSMLFAKRAFTNIKYSLVNDIVMELIKRDFFTEDLFNRFGILTSIGIQKRWINSVKKRNVEIRREYCLLPEELFPESTQNTPESTENTPETQEKPPVIPQSKVNNIIINKEVENRINKNSEKPIKETFAELAKDEAWLEVLAMNNQMKSTLAVKNKLQTFYKHLQNIGEETKSIADAKRHFANWLKTNK